MVFLCIAFGMVWRLVPHPAVIIVLSILPLGILYVLYAPFIMVLFFVIFSFFRIHEVIPQLYPLKIPLMLSLGALFALVWHIGITQKIKVFMRPEMKVMLTFYILAIVGIVFASNIGIAIANFKSIVWKVLLMTFAIIWLVKTEKQLTFTLRSIVISGLIVAFKAISNKLSGIGMVEETRVTIGRDIGSALGDPNDLSLVLMFPTAFALGVVLQPGTGKLWKILSLIAAGALSTSVVWGTQSRGGLLGVLAVFGIFAYRRIKNKLVFFIGAPVAVAILYVAAGISDRKSGGAAEDGVDASAMGRIYAWQAAFGMAVHNPLTGVGLDNFYSNYFFYSPHWDGLNHAVHSTWFQVMAETGFLGFTVFITMIIFIIRTALRTLKIVTENKESISPNILALSEATLAGFIGTLASATFLTFGFTWPIYILAALISATAHWADTNVVKSNFSPKKLEK